MICKHKFPDGTCRRYPPKFTSRKGATVSEWPKAPEGCVCGEWAPVRGAGQEEAKPKRKRRGGDDALPEPVQRD